MPGLDSLPAQALKALVEDNKADMSAYLFDKVTKLRKVSDEEGSVRRWEFPIGMGDEGSNSVKHKAGTPTPKGNTKMGEVTYSVDSYSWAEPINHLRRKSLSEIEGALAELSERAGHKAPVCEGSNACGHVARQRYRGGRIAISPKRRSVPLGMERGLRCRISTT